MPVQSHLASFSGVLLPAERKQEGDSHVPTHNVGWALDLGALHVVY